MVKIGEGACWICFRACSGERLLLLIDLFGEGDPRLTKDQHVFLFTISKPSLM